MASFTIVNSIYRAAKRIILSGEIYDRSVITKCSARKHIEFDWIYFWLVTVTPFFLVKENATCLNFIFYELEYKNSK